jgi:hypothetical protein
MLSSKQFLDLVRPFFCYFCDDNLIDKPVTETICATVSALELMGIPEEENDENNNYI